MDLRPLSVGELLDQAFRLFRQAWRPLTLLGLLSLLPTMIYTTVTVGFQARYALSGGFTTNQFELLIQTLQTNWMLMLQQLLLYILIVGLVSPIIQGALIHVASGAILRQPVTVRGALRATIRRYPALVGTALLLLLINIVALPVLTIGGLLIFAFLTIPAGYIALTVFFIFRHQAILLEGVGGGAPALKRSYALVKGRFWPLLGAGILFYMLYFVLGWIVGLVTGTLSAFLNVATPGALATWLGVLIQSLPTIVTGPFMVVGITLAYYETRTRKEGLDMTMTVDALESAADEPL